MVVVPNPNLKPEYGFSADFDAARLFGTWLKLDLAGYATLLRGALVRRPFSVNGTDSVLYGGEWNQMEALQNASFARVLGLYFGLEAKLSRAWSSKVSYNIQKGVEGLDNGQISPSRHAPPAFGWAGLTYRLARFRADVYSQFQGALHGDQLAWEERAKTEIYALDAQGRPHAPAWYTVNARASMEFKRGITVNFGLENISDQRYRPYSSGISGPGRNAVLAVAARF
jgi:hemoglobin/transferrin/lactoferrin receptor protein